MTDQLPLTFEYPAVLSVDRLWTLANAELLAMLKEDRRVERKPAGIHAPELAEYFSMWANTAAEGGLIVLGMSDDGKFVGCTGIETEHLNRLERDGYDQCPDAHVECRRIGGTRQSDQQPDFVLLFRVHYHENRVVTTVRGDAFIRRGESKHKLTQDELKDLQNDKQEVSVEQELWPGYSFPDDFNMGLVDDFLLAVRSTLSEPVPSEELLVARRLGKLKDGRFVPNGACVLLFANDPLIAFPGAKIRFLRFEGEAEGSGDQWNAVKDLLIEGSIPRLIQTTETILDGQLRDFSRLGPDQRFYTAPEYPKAAWYEAVVNACVHRSYGALKNMPVFVKMFDNRLEIESPGPFPPAVTPENIYRTHSPRNPHLMTAMWFINFVKCANEGTRRMLKLMQQSELPPPEFKQREVSYSSVRVTLRNNIKQRKVWIDSAAASIIGPEIDATLSLDERRIINHVAEHKTINVSQAVRITEKGWKSAHRLLMKLRRRGILRHHHRTDIERDPQAFFDLAPPRRTPSST
jgi:ATP-dependent DNA helicase RecG